MRSVLGLNRTTDASVCLLNDERIDTLVRKERLTRKKHASGAIGDLAIYLDAINRPGLRIDAVVQCFSSDQERARRAEYQRELESMLPLRADAVVAEVSHHFAHAYAGFFPSGFKSAAVLIADNRGSPKDLVGDTPPVRDGQDTGPLEVITAFEAHGRTIRPIARQWWNRDEPTGLGMFYSSCSWALFGREYCEGIVMGLAPFGDAHRLRLPPLQVDGISVRVGPEWREAFSNSERFGFLRGASGFFSDCADLAAATQEAFEVALVAVARNLRAMTGATRLVYAGGCALNCSANARLARDAGFDEIFIPPPCDDGGTALGCAIFGQHLLSPQGVNEVTWDTDFLGPSHALDEDRIRACAAEFGQRVHRPPNLVDAVATRLATGDVFAVFQGQSESGARALGNRSILAHPGFDATRNYINASVKGREWFRPLAPMVRVQDADKYFEGGGPSPFMQRTAKVRAEWRSRLMGVSHVDGTARFQTVSPEQNPFIYDLLERFEARTGLGVLLNTSFNGQHQPIVETPLDALSALRDLPIHGLVAPPFLIEPHERRRSPLAV